MATIQWVSGTFKKIGPSPSPPTQPRGSTATNAGDVTGGSGARVVTANVMARQLDVTGTAIATMLVGFTEDFKITTTTDVAPVLMATFNLSGLTRAYADGSVGAIPFIFPPVLPSINRASARVRGTVTAKVSKNGTPVMSFVSPFRRTSTSNAIATTRTRPYALIQNDKHTADPTATYRLEVRIDINASATVNIAYNSFSTTEGLARGDLDSSGSSARVFLSVI